MTALLNAFGTLGGIFSASHSALRKATDCWELASILQLARTAVLEGLREDVTGSTFDASDERFLKYLVAKMHRSVEEQLHTVFLDAHHRYLTDEMIAVGTRDKICVKLRSLLTRTIELNSAAIVLFHNHPSGRAEPSAADLAFTRDAKTVANALGIELYDHLIVAGQSVFSMRTAGML